MGNVFVVSVLLGCGGAGFAVWMIQVWKYCRT